MSFEVGEGELVGYLGPNGAGKSTTIKMLTGILVPTAGEVEVGGRVPWRDREQNALNIGVVFGQRTQAVVGSAPHRVVQADQKDVRHARLTLRTKPEPVY